MRGSTAYFKSDFSVASPMPLVAPANTATNRFGNAEGIRALDASTSEKFTMVKGLDVISAEWIG
jgi:hypothetical protein